MHYLLKAILLRPIYTTEEKDEEKDADETKEPKKNDETKQMLMLRAFRTLCTPPEGEPPWSALNGGKDAPGPFERGWKKSGVSNVHW